MNHFFIPDDDDGAAGRRLLSALLSAADRAVAGWVVVAVKSSSSRSGDSFSRGFFFCAPFAEPTRTKEHTKLLVFYSSLSSLLMSVRQTTARTERNDGTDCSSSSRFFHNILVAIFNGVSALFAFTSRLFRTNTPPRRFFASI